jgi:citrate synthase
MTRKHDDVRSRNETFVNRVATRIWQEEPSEHNPYLAESIRCHGYDLIELAEKRNFIDVLYLLFRGELPSSEHSQILQTLMVGLISPGPRHPATRAAMNTGIGKTDPLHILPIALMTLGGTVSDAGIIEEAIRFFRKQRHSDPTQFAFKLLSQTTKPEHEEWILAPGFGTLYGDADPFSKQLANKLLAFPGAGQAIHWGAGFSEAIASHNLGWLRAGLAAAVLSDLGFHPRTGGGFYQLLCAPGLLAQGIEMSNKPITAMPFIKDENYILETE